MHLHRCVAPLFLALSLVALPGAASQVADAIDAELARQFPPTLPGAAVLVIKDGVTILEKGYGLANVELDVPMQPQHLFYVASVGKQFTAAGIGEESRYGPGPLVKRIATMAAGMPQQRVVAQALPEAFLQQRAGVYVHGDERYTLEVKAGKLRLQYRTDGKWAPLSALSPTEFYYDENRDFRVRFFTGNNGRPALQWFEIDPLDGDSDPVFEKQ